MSEHGRAIFDNVLVKQDADLGIAQQPREGSLPIEEWEIAQILAIMLDQVERVVPIGNSNSNVLMV